MFLTGAILTSSIIICIALMGVCHVIALVSPYWLVSSRVNQAQPPDFSNLGLWAVCFDKFVHPFELPPKIYSDCYSWSSEELSDIIHWLVPHWLVISRTLAVTSTVTLTLSTLVTIFLLVWSSYQWWDKFSKRRFEFLSTSILYITPVCHIVNSIFLLLTVAIFADNAKRHQHHEFWLIGTNDIESFDLHLSLSWVFELLAFLFSCLSSALLVWFLVLKNHDEI